MSTQLSPMESAVYAYEENFNQVNPYKINFRKEAGFALQLLKSNDFLKSIAQSNPDSLQNAITNLAAIGISLNPATKEAYLVPRNRAVCLDISAIGLIKLATDSGSIKWAQAKLVYANDEFFENSIGEAPTHKIDHKNPRGEVFGVYVVAKTNDGDFLVEFMTIKECHDIRDRSEAWKAVVAGKTKSCPWSTDEGEMMKKTVIKRAQKYWPKSERVDEAIQLLNQYEGIDFNSKAPHMDAPTNTDVPNEKTFANIRALLKAKDKTEDGLLDYLATQSGGERVAKIEDLNSAGIEYAYRILGGGK